MVPNPEAMTVSYQPYPNPGRALRHIVRGHRLTRRIEHGHAHVEVIIYPGMMSAGIETELRRLISRGHGVR
jgi:hypothetical protein